ncbi:type II secretion system minor pseudopilin GspK [Ascidiaceihabitans sp.]|uniref:type II secretion system minor pseudopilin GspK n=1 Tax=Ascidiaceihabitans sp. TaxID=1872644 RepID=UPI003299E617
MNRDRGFVLVNALVLVAAMAAAAVFLLSRSETGRAQIHAAQTADQLTAYLDAFEALARLTLNRDASAASTDHLGEGWAQDVQSVPLDRGTVRGTVHDMQGRFNLNWLTNAQDIAAKTAFDDLVQRLGVSDQTADAILAFMEPGGQGQRSAFAQLTPPIDPVGGALLHIDQLNGMPGIDAAQLDRLRPYITALTGALPLNINTASATVVRGFFPDTKPSVVNAVLAGRKLDPFSSADAFLQAIEAAQGAGLGETFDRGRFDVTSNWFEMEATAALNDHSGSRKAVMFRQSLPLGAIVTYRVSTYP